MRWRKLKDYYNSVKKAQRWLPSSTVTSSMAPPTLQNRSLWTYPKINLQQTGFENHTHWWGRRRRTLTFPMNYGCWTWCLICSNFQTKIFPIIAVQTKLTFKKKKKKKKTLCSACNKFLPPSRLFFCKCEVEELTIATTRRLMSCFSHLYSLWRELCNRHLHPKRKISSKSAAFYSRESSFPFIYLFIYFQMISKTYKVQLIGKICKFFSFI
jgi:hypothetical protein